MASSHRCFYCIGQRLGSGRCAPKAFGGTQSPLQFTTAFAICHSNTFLTFSNNSIFHISFQSVHIYSKFSLTTHILRYLITLVKTMRYIAQSPHNPEVVGSSPTPATITESNLFSALFFYAVLSRLFVCVVSLSVQ